MKFQQRYKVAKVNATEPEASHSPSFSEEKNPVQPSYRSKGAGSSS